ncbi:hypothetical protein CEXT_366861 [Caerostris extrusa]|uniref:Uncharacterized protein n=1 Tax=Caerostris extrusa TaxID=172846 RepID=A0AAV4W733_CAEEX|nr:hypothetical protein CEXT_366861 [Caerostris extrusa]
MLIDDRNMAKIHAMRFFSEVAAAMEPQVEEEDLGRSNWKACGWKIKRRRKKNKKKIFPLSPERLRLPTHIEDPVFILSIKMRFLGNGDVFRGTHFYKAAGNSKLSRQEFERKNKMIR